MWYNETPLPPPKEEESYKTTEQKPERICTHRKQFEDFSGPTF